MPSAQEVDANGINREMEMILLKKVEELTLYLLNQDKKLNQLIETNTQRQIKIEELQKEIRGLQK